MSRIIFITISLLLIGKLDAQTLAGPYAPPAGQLGTTAIHKDSSIIVGWATSATIERGWQNITDTLLGKTTAGNDTSATDKSGVNGTVSLGDGGMATLTFDGTIYDGLGADFTVFENSFDGLFLELAFVEVSSDGINFTRFESISLTDTAVQTSSFGNTDATEIHNLAGKYVAQYGTPFDLNELFGSSGLDINSISHVRIVDVVGNIDELYATYDSQGRAINDPWSTAFPVGGFDLDAIGVINFSPSAVDENIDDMDFSIYPNPSTDKIYFKFKTNNEYSFSLRSMNGIELAHGKLADELDINYLDAGVYFLYVYTSDKVTVRKIVKQ